MERRGNKVKFEVKKMKDELMEKAGKELKKKKEKKKEGSRVEERSEKE